MLLGGGGGLDNGGGVLGQLLYLSLNGGHVAPEGEIGSNVWGRWSRSIGLNMVCVYSLTMLLIECSK